MWVSPERFLRFYAQIISNPPLHVFNQIKEEAANISVKHHWNLSFRARRVTPKTEIPITFVPRNVLDTIEDAPNLCIRRRDKY